MFRKKGQITLFIIIGLLIVLSVSLVFYVKTRTAKEREEVEHIIKEVPLEVKPIKEFVENCIKDIATEGLKKIGMNGGYISLDRKYTFRDIRVDKDNVNPTEYDAFSFSKGNYLPYWWYMKSDNKCLDSYGECHVSSANIPSLSEIEEQLNVYINENLKKCLNDFKDFKKQGFVFEGLDSEVSTKTTISDKDVMFDVKYEFSVKKNEQRYQLKDFSRRIDLRFKDIYNLALLIMLYEKDTQKFENMTTQLIQLYAFPLSSEKIPPISWIDWKLSTVQWSKKKTKERVGRDVISANMPYVRVEGTKLGIPVIVDKDRINEIREIQNKINKGEINFMDVEPNLRNLVMLQSIYDNLFINFSKSFGIKIHEPTVSVNFIYDDRWPLYFDVTPSKGDLLMPSIHRENMPFIGVKQENNYEFYYDISYPVAVVIRDSNALKSEGLEGGYSFMFAFEVNIRDNKNLWEWNQGKGTIRWSYGNVKFEINPEANKNDNISTEDLFLPEKTLFCDKNLWISDAVIKTYDKETNLPLEDVSVSFGCGTYKACSLNPTKYNGSDALIRTKLPVCIGQGYFVLYKEGYEEKIATPISIEPYDKKEFSFYLEKEKDVNITVRRIDITNLKTLLDSRDMMFNITRDLLDILYDMQSYDRNISIYITKIENIKHNITEWIILWNETTITQFFDYISNIKDSINKANAEVEKYCIKKYGTTMWGYTYKTRKCIDNTRKQLTNFAYLLKDIENTKLSFLDSSDSRDFVTYFRDNSKEIRENEEVIVNINKVKKVRFSSSFSQAADFVNSSEDKKIKLVSGNFSLSINYLDNNGVFIEANSTRICELCGQQAFCNSNKCRQWCLEDDSNERLYQYKVCGHVFLSGAPVHCGKCQVDIAIPEEDIEIKPAPLGGAELNKENGYWSLDNEDLGNAKRIVFYFLRGTNPELITEMEGMTIYSDYKRYRQFIEPEIIKED